MHHGKVTFLMKIKARISLKMDSIGSYGRTKAKCKVEGNTAHFHWYEFETNKLTGKLEFTNRQLSLPIERLVEAASGKTKNPYGLDDIGCVSYTDRGGTEKYINISEGTEIGMLFVYYREGVVDLDLPPRYDSGFDISRRKFNKLLMSR